MNWISGDMSRENHASLLMVWLFTWQRFWLGTRPECLSRIKMSARCCVCDLLTPDGVIANSKEEVGLHGGY